MIAGVNGRNSEGMCQGGKPGTGKLYTDVCLCCSAHTSGCVVDGLGATAAFYYHMGQLTSMDCTDHCYLLQV